MYERKQIFTDLGKESAFLWGARQTGKSTLLKSLYPNALYIDLLLANEYNRFLSTPDLLKQILDTGTQQSLVS